MHITFTCQTAPAAGYQAYITPALVFLSTVIAYLALRNARSVARQKATLDLIEKEESNEHYRTISAKFSELRRNGGLTHPNTSAQEQLPDRSVILDHLNHYEIVAIGIRQNILDTKIYRAWMEGTFVRDWNAAADWVQRERWKQDASGEWRYRDSIYKHYQWVACRWSKDARRLTKASSPPPIIATSPGDEALPDPIDEIVLKGGQT